MNKMLLFVLAALSAALFVVAPAAAQSGPPQVVGTNPAEGVKDLDSHTTVISVTFDRPMTDGSWSWVMEDGAAFPTVTGDPFFSEDMRTCFLPVSLESMTSYVVWINSDEHQNFRDQNGVPAAPYRLVFATLQ